jgi:hypothetical protein
LFADLFFALFSLSFGFFELFASGTNLRVFSDLGFQGFFFGLSLLFMFALLFAELFLPTAFSSAFGFFALTPLIVNTLLCFPFRE